MLTSIWPLGERARKQSYWTTTAFYVAGSTLAGASLGAVLGFVGAATLGLVVPGNEAALVVVGVAAAVGLAADWRWRGRHLPGPARQVNENWLVAYRGWVYGGGFGVQLGVGVATFVVVSATYVVLVGALVSGSALAGGLVGATFGCARALPILVNADVDDHPQLVARLRRIQSGRRFAHFAVLFTQASAAVVAVVLATSGVS